MGFPAGLAVAGLFSAGGSMLSQGKRRRHVKELETKLENAGNDPYKYSLTRHELDQARLSMAAGSPRSKLLHILTLGLSTTLGNNTLKAEENKIGAEVLALASPDLTDKGSMYYLLFKAMDPGTSLRVRTDVAVFLAGRPQQTKDELIDLLTAGKKSSGMDHNFYLELDRLGNSRLAVGKRQFQNAREFMLSCLRGEQSSDAAANTKAAAPATPAAGKEPAVLRKPLRRSATAHVPQPERVGGFKGTSSWFRAIY
ncbi:MAG: hypothetical protein WC490_02490 [Candidatus Margulisiibacteriota bacterium]